LVVFKIVILCITYNTFSKIKIKTFTFFRKNIANIALKNNIMLTFDRPAGDPNFIKFSSGYRSELPEILLQIQIRTS
jgi:hypothetical protein